MVPAYPRDDGRANLDEGPISGTKARIEIEGDFYSRVPFH